MMIGRAPTGNEEYSSELKFSIFGVEGRHNLLLARLFSCRQNQCCVRTTMTIENNAPELLGEVSAAEGATTELIVTGSAPDIEPTRLDADAVRVLLRLRQHHHEAYLVGGCVRDLLIGKEPKDFDIATSATPNQVRALFRNCRLIGRRFRLAHVYFKGGKILEVSTFRAMPTLVEEPQPSEAKEGEVHSEGTDHIAAADAEAVRAVDADQEVPSAPVADVQDEVTAPADVTEAPD
jgi:hypothetical protein